MCTPVVYHDGEERQRDRQRVHKHSARGEYLELVGQRLVDEIRKLVPDGDECKYPWWGAIGLRGDVGHDQETGDDKMLDRQHIQWFPSTRNKLVQK